MNPHINFKKSQDKAVLAAYSAGEARIIRDRLTILDQTIKTWDKIMNNEPVILYTVIFMISIPVELWLSFEMYKLLLSSFTTSPAIWMVWCLGIFTAAFAALASHMLSKRFSIGLKSLEIHHEISNSSELGNLSVEIEEKAVRRHKRQTILGAILAITILTIVFMTSLLRSMLMKEMNERDITIIEMLIPLVVVFVEIITGIYLSYCINYTRLLISRAKCQRTFDTHKQNCINHTNMAYAMLIESRQTGESCEATKDLCDAMYRVSYCSPSSPSYIDEINIKQCRLAVQRGKAPAINARVIGTLQNTGITSATFTNDQGEAVLFWPTDNLLHSIEIEGQIFTGPFHPNMTHSFCLNEKPLIAIPLN